MRSAQRAVIVMAHCCLLAALAQSAGPEIRIGSKAFTESVILGEMATQIVNADGAAAVHRRQLGGTRVLWNALVGGDIDVYPEYTGTIVQEIFAGRLARSDSGPDAIRKALAQHGVEITRSLGFSDTYALGMKESEAERLGIRAISDLRRYPDLRFGFSNEFMSRADGWPSLRDHYRLPQRDVRGLDHDLAYRGINDGAMQITDLYSTDAEIRYYGLRVLDDDLRHFPPYEAVLLYRQDLLRRAPGALNALLRLEHRISQSAMVEMNARAKLDHVPETRIAADFLSSEFHFESAFEAGHETMPQRLWRNTRDHLMLVGLSMAAAILIAVPLGILAAKSARIGHVILALVGVIQTIPSLALLVFMIPLLGIGAMPAIVALFLYSLLPIVRNTYAGLHDIPRAIQESAAALGLPAGARLRLIELPMASRAILAGIKTSVVINIGTATLGALIGAGGYGQPILTGIRLDDRGLILEGAIPAALLALAAQGLFELLERAVVPKGLRITPAA